MSIHVKSLPSAPSPAPTQVKGAIQGRLLDRKLLELPGCFDGLWDCSTGHLEILETPGCVITVARQLTCLVMCPSRGGGGCYQEETFTQCLGLPGGHPGD